jgi:hypothetical protein
VPVGGMALTRISARAELFLFFLAQGLPGFFFQARALPLYVIEFLCVSQQGQFKNDNRKISPLQDTRNYDMEFLPEF